MSSTEQVATYRGWNDTNVKLKDQGQEEFRKSILKDNLKAEKL
jgi:hypothetical protein